MSARWFATRRHEEVDMPPFDAREAAPDGGQAAFAEPRSTPPERYIDGRRETVEYTIRRSDRARRVRLSISPAEGLVVVIPRRFPAREVPAVVAERRVWIERTLERFAPEREELLRRAAAPLIPDEIELRALGECWGLRVQLRAGAPRVRELSPYVLAISGAPGEEAVQRALLRWLSARARAELVPWLGELARERSITVQGTSIRAQRTRWASCSSDGRISLNRNLLFLPRRLVRLVLLHELCHRIELNHSERFWALLECEEPQRKALEDELARAWRFVPRWAGA